MRVPYSLRNTLSFAWREVARLMTIVRDDQGLLWTKCLGKASRDDLVNAVAELLKARHVISRSIGEPCAAAEKMKVSYHRAWEKLHEMETRLGVTLVETQTGGEHGGGARLTATAHDYVARFEQFSQGIDETVARRFAQAFGPQ